MAKSLKKIDKENDGQMSFFDLLIRGGEEDDKPAAGSLNIDNEFRELISLTLKDCPYSRYHVAARMSELAGHEITKTMLDSWTAESKENHRFPAIFLPAFCSACGISTAIDFLGRKAGKYLLPGKQALRAEVQKLKEKKSRINKEIKKGETRLQVLEEVET